MHTRYSPVRRSPSEYCYPMLPLDLHVLSLPLAFILSQDQTLHCKNLFFLFLNEDYPRSHSKILTSFLDEIVFLAWLLLHSFKELSICLSFPPKALFPYFTFGTSKLIQLIVFTKKIEIFFPAAFPSSFPSVSVSRNLYLF